MKLLSRLTLAALALLLASTPIGAGAAAPSASGPAVWLTHGSGNAYVLTIVNKTGATYTGETLALTPVDISAVHSPASNQCKAQAVTPQGAESGQSVLQCAAAIAPGVTTTAIGFTTKSPLAGGPIAGLLLSDSKGGTVDFRISILSSTTATAKADLVVTTSGPLRASELRMVSYTFAITNHGPDVAKKVVLTLGFTGSPSPIAKCLQGCSIGTVAKGATAKRTVTVEFIGAGTYGVLGSASADTSDPSPTNNVSTTTVIVG